MELVTRLDEQCDAMDTDYPLIEVGDTVNYWHFVDCSCHGGHCGRQLGFLSWPTSSKGFSGRGTVLQWHIDGSFDQPAWTVGDQPG